MTQTANQTKMVTIYSTPTCHFCHMAKELFTAQGITFTDHNVGSDLEKRKEMMEKSGQLGVPVIVITNPAVPEGNSGHEEVIIGFDEMRLAELLGF